MQLLKISLRELGSDEEINVVGSFTDKELRTLESFLTLADRALESRCVKDGCPAKFRLHWELGQPERIKADLPDWEDVQAFLHRIRPFILQRENTFFPKVCNLVARRFEDPVVYQVLAPMRDHFAGKSLQSTIMVRSNDVVLNSPETVDAWLNAYEFQQDSEKQEWIESLHRILPLETSKVFFLMLLTDRLEAVMHLAKLIQVILGHPDEIELQAKRGVK